MEEMVMSFLSENYNVAMSTFSSYKYENKIKEIYIGANELKREVGSIFGSGEDDKEIQGLVEKWTKQEIGLLAVKVNHVKYQYYKKFGQDIKDIGDLNKILKKVVDVHNCVQLDEFMPKS